MDETPKKRQINELSALRAIYDHEIDDLRTGNKWKPLDLLINLKPQQGSISNTLEIHVKVDLHIKCSLEYPHEIPELILKNSKGLSRSLLNELHSELMELAKKKTGEEMILELCYYVQEYLHTHNKPLSKSFYDEMQQRRKKEEMQQQQDKKMEEDRQKKCVEEEVNKIYSRLEEENYKSRRKSNSVSDEHEAGRLDSLISDRRKNRKASSGDNSGDSQCSHKPVEIVCFDTNGTRQILRGKCIKHCDCSRSIYTGMDEVTGENFIIYEWKVDTSKCDVHFINKQVNFIEQEFKSIIKLKHKNLALYHNFSYIVDEPYVIIQVLKEFINGSSCYSLFRRSNNNTDIPYLKYIARGVLEALEYLHEKNVIHRDLKDTRIFINSKGIVKVCNYSIHQRLTDLVCNVQSATYGKKLDIHKFGVFLLCLLQGSSLPEDDDISVPDSLPSDLYDLLNKCLVKNEKNHCSASELLKHPFFYQKPSVHLKLDDKSEGFHHESGISTDPLHRDLFVGSRNQSRINTEFELIESIGEGAFGAVEKYRNKLDGRFYAIKRIKLNPKNKQLNKKIRREVQLLSRLNHENVVRYYNSWIETSEVMDEDRSASSGTPSSFYARKQLIVKGRDELTLNDNIEELAPSIKNEKISITFDSESQLPYEDSTSESESSDEDEENNGWAVREAEDSDSDGVHFENSKTTVEMQMSDYSISSPPENRIKIDFMYIQMEFCEKSTLKTAIDANLCEDGPRVQRLFREILEGLAHIHQQGMIHRDLKPVNIFLDMKDHVKIGDFGLATTNLKSKLNDYTITRSAVESIKDEIIDESKTGHVGTYFYVAPELNVPSKAIYNEKVDIYSLGIILFEMCYKPPSTGMERSEILQEIRQEKIIFPEDYKLTLVAKHACLIRWLLDHDPSKRPTSLELFQSKYVPPPILEEKKLMDLIRHTLNNPQSKGYKYLIASCFDQNLSPAQDITYDRDLSNTALSKPLEIYYEYVKRVTVEVFRKHGGQNLSTPLLMPNSKIHTFYNTEDNCVRLMTHGGGVVYLPYDLRVSFARYIAWNNISLFRRYSIERVYREKKVFGFIPRELYECAFDVVTPTPGSFMPDGEVLYIVFEIISKLPIFNNKNIVIHLNHTKLLRAILLHYGLKIENHTKFIEVFSDMKGGKLNRTDLLIHLVNLGLSETQAMNLWSMLNSEFEATKMSSNFQMITKKSNAEYSKEAKTALQELKTIIEISEAMGLSFEIVLTPGLIYNSQQFSGMICQFVCEFKKRKHHKMEVLAAGGRYDAMVSQYRNMQKGIIFSKDSPQSAVGISISLDKIVQAIQKEQSIEENTVGHFDVMVCMSGNKRHLNEKLKILSSLSASGLRWILLEGGSDKEIEEEREELKIPHILILKDTDIEKVIMRCWEKERFQQEKTFTVPELMEDLSKVIKRVPLQYFSQDNMLTRSDSKSYVEKQQTSDSIAIIFHTSEKLTPSTKKRYEVQIYSQLSDFCKRLVGQVIVLAVNIDVNVIKTLSAILDFQSEKIFQKSVDSVIEKHSRSKKVLRELCDVIYENKFKSSKPFLILYSLLDSGHKLIM